MLEHINEPLTFAVETAEPLASAPGMQEPAETQSLTNIWLDFLGKEQEQIKQQDTDRHPLAFKLKTRHLI